MSEYNIMQRNIHVMYYWFAYLYLSKFKVKCIQIKMAGSDVKDSKVHQFSIGTTI